jgi:predicted nucleic acid-binding protein
MVSSFVLDASVAAAWCFADETTPEIDALRESLAERRAVVPRLWHTETTNLLLMAERRQRFKPERCEELLELLA